MQKMYSVGVLIAASHASQDITLLTLERSYIGRVWYLVEYGAPPEVASAFLGGREMSPSAGSPRRARPPAGAQRHAQDSGRLALPAGPHSVFLLGPEGLRANSDGDGVVPC